MEEEMGRKCAQHPVPIHALGLLWHTPMANAGCARGCCRPVISQAGRWKRKGLGTVGVMSALPNVRDLRNLTIDALSVRAW